MLEVMLFSPGRTPFKGPLKEAATLSSSVGFGCLQEPLLRLIPICFGELSREKGCRHEVPLLPWPCSLGLGVDDSKLDSHVLFPQLWNEAPEDVVDLAEEDTGTVERALPWES